MATPRVDHPLQPLQLPHPTIALDSFLTPQRSPLSSVPGTASLYATPVTNDTNIERLSHDKPGCGILEETHVVSTHVDEADGFDVVEVDLVHVLPTDTGNSTQGAKDLVEPEEAQLAAERVPSRNSHVAESQEFFDSLVNSNAEDGSLSHGSFSVVFGETADVPGRNFIPLPPLPPVLCRVRISGIMSVVTDLQGALLSEFLAKDEDAPTGARVEVEVRDSRIVFKKLAEKCPWPDALGKAAFAAACTTTVVIESAFCCLGEDGAWSVGALPRRDSVQPCTEAASALISQAAQFTSTNSGNVGLVSGSFFLTFLTIRPRGACFRARYTLASHRVGIGRELGVFNLIVFSSCFLVTL